MQGLMTLPGRVAMTNKWSAYGLLFASVSVFAEDAARLEYSSANDFTEISLELKSIHNLNADTVSASITLSEEAKARTTAITTLTYGKQMTLYIDGRRLYTSHVQGIMGGSLRVAVPKDLAAQWATRYLH
ncbi:hypothetical protein QMK52_00485 [Pseudomonas sp. P9_2]|uniref:hypothetical protein n=1 Tax=Pseudomonas TaxID=286 RepID=UPI00068100EE|nr:MULTISPECIES: hypothetical protein [Pseudomonas]WPN52654.1 hypothetical protein QMK52_00485 [Pseudomonas sp. P9_2]